MRRNRIKAVINVPRGRPAAPASPAPGNERPLTPITSNFNAEPASPLGSSPSSCGLPASSPGIPNVLPSSPVKSFVEKDPPVSFSQQQQPPLSPVSRGKSPSTVQLPPSSSLLRSPSPSPSRLNVNHPNVVLPSKSPSHPSSSSSTLSVSSPFHPPLGSPSYNTSHYYTGPSSSLLGDTARNENVLVRRDVSPEKRPPPVSSPFRPLGSPATPPPPARPSPAPSPGTGFAFPSPVAVPHLFNSNSNSADSHEVARFMANGSPALVSPGAIVPYVNNSAERRPPSSNSNSSFGRAFSGFDGVKDHASSIVGNSDLLKQRLSKPCPSLTVSKYHILRKEFMSKYNQTPPPDKNQLTILHYAFWNPPKNGGRNRASSVSSERGRRPKSSLSDHDATSRQSLPDAGGKRRVTIETIPLSSPAPSSIKSRKDSDEESNAGVSDAESTGSSQKSVGPRVKVGPDGQLIIDEQSLVVETSESQRAKKQLSEMETVSGADFVVGSSGLFRNKKSMRRGVDWSEKETVKFYRALSMCGTDFSMMTTLFPCRSRAELKAKFKREDKRNPEQISLALKCQEFDPDEGWTSSEDESEAHQQNEGEQTVAPKQKVSKAKKRTAGEFCPKKKPTKNAWKSQGLKKSDLANLEDDSVDSVIDDDSQNTQTPKKKKCLPRNRITTDIFSAQKKPKADKKVKPTVKVKVEKAIKQEKRVQDPSDRENPSDHETDPGEVDKQLPTYLVYVPSDPLGTQVPLARQHSSEFESSGIAEESQIHHLSSADHANSSGEEPCEDSQSEMDTSGPVSQSSQKLTELKVIPPPYRVPGPGGRPANALSPTLADEIEIEISCQ